LAALASERSALRAYWTKSRAPRYSVVFALPLFVFYELLAASLAGSAGGVRNAADVALKTPFLIFSGARGSLAFFATVIAVCVFIVVRDYRKTRERPKPKMFVLMLGEAAVLALVLGVVVGLLTQRLLGALSLSLQAAPPQTIETLSAPTRLMLSLGAGLYEELLFRVLLVGGLAFGFRWLLGARSLTAGIAAAAIGALIFSAFHYIGQFGEPLELRSFTYRAIAGLVFSGLYLTRGFGITAWTHALYDVYVMLL
jgi:hypothetical protein